MKLLPIKEKETAKVVCLVDEVDKAIRILRFIFMDKCKIKVAIHNQLATIVVTQ